MTLILSKTQLMLRYQQLSTYSNLSILLDDYLLRARIKPNYTNKYPKTVS